MVICQSVCNGGDYGCSFELVGGGGRPVVHVGGLPRRLGMDNNPLLAGNLA